MKVGNLCLGCIEGLIEKTLKLIGKGEDYLERFKGKLNELWNESYSPPAIASEILRSIRREFLVDDPYIEVKKREFEEARLAFCSLNKVFGDDFEGALKLSAIGNSSDYFLDSVSIKKDGFFVLDLKEMERELSKSRDVLILGDNVSDFVFDQKLIEYALRMGKMVYYCVKGGPAQNDLTIDDVRRFGLHKFFKNFISTASDSVGLNPSDLKGELKRLWEKDTFILAKGMGNYESITEFSSRPIAYVMKVKCEEVSKSVGYPLGTYLAILREGRA